MSADRKLSNTGHHQNLLCEANTFPNKFSFGKLIELIYTYGAGTGARACVRARARVCGLKPSSPISSKK